MDKSVLVTITAVGPKGSGKSRILRLIADALEANMQVKIKTSPEDWFGTEKMEAYGTLKDAV